MLYIDFIRVFLLSQYICLNLIYTFVIRNLNKCNQKFKQVNSTLSIDII